MAGVKRGGAGGPVRPHLLVIAPPGADELVSLFSTRGFLVTVAKDRLPLRVDVALVDGADPRAQAFLLQMIKLDPKPALIGIHPPTGPKLEERFLDAAFSRPVDPARLFADTVKIVAGRKHKRRKDRITGVVAVIHGSSIFHLVEEELVACGVSMVNAGAILEAVFQEMGVSPFKVEVPDVLAAVQSGRLNMALDAFLDAPQVRACVHAIKARMETAT